jgi:hypothetical protein
VALHARLFGHWLPALHLHLHRLNTRSGTSREKAQETQRGTAATDQEKQTGRLKTGKWDMSSFSCLQSFCLFRLSPSPAPPANFLAACERFGLLQCKEEKSSSDEAGRTPDLTYPTQRVFLDLELWGAEIDQLAVLNPRRTQVARCAVKLTSIHPSSFILHPFREGALPGRSAAAARLRSWRWGKTATKPVRFAYCRPPPALAGWGRNE